MNFDIAPLGDRAITIRFGDRLDATLAAQARGLAARVREVSGVQDAVPGYATVTVFFDPALTNQDTIAKAIGEGINAEPVRGIEHIIPVRYDGPDLEEVAQRTGLSVAEVISRHQAAVYTVYLIGFVPGFAYLGQVDASLDLPRRATPRTRVPAGSVAIAGRQTAIYPLDTPGGWHLVGRTDVTMFDPMSNPPSRFAAGDTVQFVPIES
jgi:KipI family sensor histidine kinase inhibitor